jgi:hypothetical protein
MVRALLSLFFLSSPLWGQLGQNGDTQYWQRTAFRTGIADRLKGEAAVELRWGDDISRLYFGYGEGILFYEWRQWLALGPGYRQAFIRGNQNEWHPIWVPFFQVEPRRAVGKWYLSNRNRLQLNISGRRGSVWLYRSRFIALTPPVFWKVRCHLEEELFFREGAGFDENRAFIGLGMRPLSPLSGSIGYMYRSLKQNRTWRYENVLRLFLTFSY